MEDSFLEIYTLIKKNIEVRIEEFERVWKNGTEEDIFRELAFCILTPQSKARNAWGAILKLTENNLLYKGHSEDIVEFLNVVRFKNKKSLYLVEAREFFTEEGKIKIKEKIKEQKTEVEKREWIVSNIKGIGYKEAGHFLRNIGFGKTITILDRHILKNLALAEIIEKVPENMNKKNYMEIEEKMKKYAEKIKIPLEHLDFVMWYKEAGEVFK